MIATSIEEFPKRQSNSLASLMDEPTPIAFRRIDDLRLCSERDQTLSLIHELGELESNWDGYDASAIGGDIASNAASIVTALGQVGMPYPDVLPMPNGTIHFEWKSALGEACLEIGKTRFSGYAKRATMKNEAKPIYIQGDIASLYSNLAIAANFVSSAVSVLFGPRFSRATVTSISFVASW